MCHHSGASLQRSAPRQAVAWHHCGISRNRFVVDQGAVEGARRLLGIEKRVDVLVRYFSSGDHGRYIREEADCHVISIDSGQSATAASKTIWHELEHALHVQELGGYAAWNALTDREHEEALARKRLRRGLSRRQYRRLPHEQRASRTERRHRHDFPLARPSA
jgi:hypothetical protein